VVFPFATDVVIGWTKSHVFYFLSCTIA